MGEGVRGCGYRKSVHHKNWQEPKITAIALSYLAGLIDGDGSILILKRDRTGRGSLSFTVTVKVGGETEHITKLATQYGIGNVWVRKKVGLKHLAEWTIAGNQARWLLNAIKPYLQLKNPQACVALAMPQCRSRWDATAKLRAIQHTCHLQMKQLNHAKGRGSI